jgi:imidazolonepropionase-like amidohydrolase
MDCCANTQDRLRLMYQPAAGKRSSMRSITIRIAVSALLLSAGLPVRGPAQPSRTFLTPGVTLITNVTLVPMTGDVVILDAAVLIRDGRIAWIGSGREARAPSDARVVDGRGGFLLPGLADMHTHLYSDQYVPDSVGSAEMGVLLANGITTARLMIGTPAQLRLRKDIESGRIVGPNLWIASPHLTGRPDTNARLVTTPVQARAAVREVGPVYDFVKITSFLSPDVYEAIMDEARRGGFRVDGHVNTGVPVERAARLGQHLQHLDGWFEAILADSAPEKVSLTQYGVFDLRKWATLDYMDERKIAPLAGVVARSGVGVTPTLALFNTVFAAGESDSAIRNRPDWKLIPVAFRAAIQRARARYWAAATEAARTPARRQRYVDLRNAIVKALADSGARLLAGSDAPDWFMAEGYALHRELEALVNAGLTPRQALEAATRNPAEFLGAAAAWGTIEVGKRADLVLLRGNPLDDIRNSTRVEATVIGGRWLPRSELDDMVALAIRQINP